MNTKKSFHLNDWDDFEVVHNEAQFLMRNPTMKVTKYLEIF
jgi:hypothetical protein